jgi:selenocysteine lyase/cysteine desulfurase
MGVPDDVGFTGIRVSQGWSTTQDDVDRLLEAIARILKTY